ncbi:MAG TPA: type II toxin-antitoxin system RelE/ParE family toxin [Xanthomonadaceae bacterium]|nr:type II toxin-antitoxin system RelE/ParE family toxin [Xanthomonadaceae bacterium]
MKPLSLREQARTDADEAATRYAEQGGLALELAFVDALQAAYELIQRHPGAGSIRHAEHVPGLPSPLRFKPLKRFDHHLVYYIDLPGHVEVIRVWHASRGLEALLTNP